MKNLLLLLLLSCCAGYGQEHAEYAIARKALEHFPEYGKYRLIAQLNNSYIDGYLNGFYSGEVYGEETLDFRNIKFAYADARVVEWELKNKLWGAAEEKIEIIKDFEKIPKVKLTETNQAKTYVRLSNPAFSTDGNYAIIFFEHFTNMNGTEAEGFVLIFKKINNEWVYFNQFTAYLS